MAVAALCRSLALHECQPQPAQQHKLFARQGEVAAPDVVDLLRSQPFAEKVGGAVYVAHDEGEVAKAEDGLRHTQLPVHSMFRKTRTSQCVDDIHPRLRVDVRDI